MKRLAIIDEHGEERIVLGQIRDGTAARYGIVLSDDKGEVGVSIQCGGNGTELRVYNPQGNLAAMFVLEEGEPTLFLNSSGGSGRVGLGVVEGSGWLTVYRANQGILEQTFHVSPEENR